MKQFSILLGLVLFLVACGGQNTDTAADMTEETVPFDLNAALTRAQAENKPVLLEFTGSDWCPPCKLMEKEVFSTQEFKQFQDKQIIFGKLDYPRSKPQSAEVKRNNAELAEKFEIQAFPTIVLLDASGQEVWRQEGYGGGGAKALIAQVEEKTKK
ncbi:MAG: thioredoxin family protein [Limisphaerales bacterium]